jgi:hypothetical protein
VLGLLLGLSDFVQVVLGKMLVVAVVGFYWVVGLVAVVFVLVLVGAVGHLLVYVGAGLDFLDYFVYLFALGGDVAVSRIHLQVLCE